LPNRNPGRARATDRGTDSDTRGDTGDAAALELPDASVDVIGSNLGINNFEDPAAVLRASFRVARPGATLLLTTNLVSHMAEFYQVYREVLVDTGQQDRLDALDAHIAHRGTVESVGRLIREAGFTVGEIATDSFRMRFAAGSALLRHHFIRLGFVEAWKAIAARDALQPTFERLEREPYVLAARQGELALTIPMAWFVAVRAA
jgi:SAM-dependent methyltransferase